MGINFTLLHFVGGFCLYKMKTILILLALVGICCAQTRTLRLVPSPNPYQSAIFNQYQFGQNRFNNAGKYNAGRYAGNNLDGRYRSDNSGRYVDDGRYIHDNSGQYIPDGSGRYNGDGSGRYNGEGIDSSRYAGGGGQYVSDLGGQYNDKNAFGKGPGGFDTRYNSGKDAGFSGKDTGIDKLAGAAQNQFGKTVLPPGSGSGSNFGNLASATSNTGKFVETGWKILRQENEADEDGYHYLYDTENRISVEERGKLHNKGTDQEAMRAVGFFQFTGPDNVIYKVTYTSDENGFIPEGAHLPTPPPVPDYILKSLEYQRSIGEL